MSSPLPNKRDVTVALLQSSFSVFVHLDPRRERVSVPPQFRRQPHLILEIGLNMPVPIHDLVVDDDGITCTLSFNRSPHWCRMPWSSVFAIVGQDQRGMVWPNDVPADSQFRFAQVPQEEAKPKPRAVRAVRSDTPEEPVADEEKTDTQAEADGADETRAEAPPPEADDAEGRVEEGSTSPEPAPKSKGRKLPPYLRVVK